jgi:hypothetical protein
MGCTAYAGYSIIATISRMARAVALIKREKQSFEMIASFPHSAASARLVSSIEVVAATDSSIRENVSFSVFDTNQDHAVRSIYRQVSSDHLTIRWNALALLAWKFTSAGQVCIYACQILVDENGQEAFVEELLATIIKNIHFESPWYDMMNTIV